MLRLFVAIDLPAPITRALAAHTAPLRVDRAVRWVAPESLHLTLKFLGDTPEERVPEVIGALEEATGAHGPLDLVIGGFGTFPHRGPARVLWVGVDGDLDGLAALAAAVERSLAPLGWPPEERPFTPHVTLGRARKGSPRRAVHALTDLGEVGRFTAEALVLFASELKSTGAVHVPLASVPLRVQIPDTR